jgi:hypothetical protein
MCTVKQSFSLILLLGALIGLFGQSAALAGGLRATATSTAVTSPQSDCMGMMQKPPEQKPCKGLTLDCVAAMGCIAPMLPGEPIRVAVAPATAMPTSAVPIVALVGRSVAPELEPPSLLI